ncbi:M48 family metalloprotease [Micromonospora sp. C51]|uniref:M48 family metalloprotease n=1 Tax=Micromonospora sp. C51 TaxID=2824879 RepID=UPI001B36D29A|nr:M48 family metalloprotease [Micromonospora sp. C51]MBQ1052328.1 M48 family metalloprotease [Micromonospora sp. C51]
MADIPSPPRTRSSVPEVDIARPEPNPGRLANRPPGYPNALVWLRVGILRDWRGVLGSFVAAWFYVPVALFTAVVLAAVAGLVLAFTGGSVFVDQVPDEIRDAPVIGGLVSSFLEQSGGAIGAFVGAGLAFLVGLLLVPVLRFSGADGAVSVLTQLVGIAAAAIVVGVLYTLYRVLLEDRLLRVSGARDLSRREKELVIPILHECAERLGLPAVPRLLVEDDLVSTNARTYARHIVVTTGLLTDPRDEIAALLSHELVHWRTGDEITSAFVRGVGLPLVLVHAVPTWLMRRFPHPATNLFVFLFFWPVLLTMKYLVQPLHRADVRAAEYRADLGAVVTGHTEGLRAVLERRRSFESGRSGWDEAVCAEHPPNELRLERLESVRTGDDTLAPQTPPRRVVDTEELFGGDDPVDLRRPAVVGGVALLSFCLLSSLLGVVQWGFFRPETAVDGYFSALADRDVDDLAGWLNPEAGAAVRDDDLLTESIRSADYQPPTDIDIRSIEREDDEATATVSFTVGGSRTEAQVLLRRDEESTLGIFKGWHVFGGVSTLSVVAGQQGLMLNGVSVPESPQEQTVISVPGLHVVTAAANPLSEVAPQRIMVLPGTEFDTPIQAVPELRATARGSIDGQVKTYLDECARQTVAAPQGCPFRLSGYQNAKDLKWTIDRYPTTQIDMVGPAVAQVSTPYDGQGEVRVTGTYESFYGKETLIESYVLGVTGVVTVTGDELSFQPDVDE